MVFTTYIWLEGNVFVHLLTFSKQYWQFNEHTHDNFCGMHLHKLKYMYTNLHGCGKHVIWFFAYPMLMWSIQSVLPLLNYSCAVRTVTLHNYLGSEATPDASPSAAPAATGAGTCPTAPASSVSLHLQTKNSAYWIWTGAYLQIRLPGSHFDQVWPLQIFSLLLFFAKIKCTLYLLCIYGFWCCFQCRSDNSVWIHTLFLVPDSIPSNSQDFPFHCQCSATREHFLYFAFKTQSLSYLQNSTTVYLQ